MAEAHVAVVGGGPSGLVAARHVAESGLDVDVYEAADTVGGRVRSRSNEGFTLDRGFQVLLTGYPAIQRELDLDELDLRTIPPGAVLCGRHTRSILADPFRDPRALTETLFNREVTTGDKLRLWRLQRELRKKSRSSIFAGADRSTVAELRDRGFSDAFVESFAAPFFGGVTLDPSLSTSSRVFELVFKALAEGETVLPAAGMGAIPEQLAARAKAAGVTIHLDSPVSDVASKPTHATVTVDDEVHRADAAIVATDAPTARELTGIESIPTRGRSCVTQYYALPEPAAPDGRRLHLGAPDEGPAHVLTLSNVVPEYGDGERALLEATFLEQFEAADARLDDLTRRALEAWYPERHFGDLQLLATDRIEFGQFAQPPGIHADLPNVDAPEGRCYLAGEYTRWSALSAALDSGRDAARQVLADL